MSVVASKFLRRFWVYAVALFLSRLAILLLVVVPILPPLVWSRWLFVPEAVLLEGASVVESVRRSSRISQGPRGVAAELMFWISAVFVFSVVAAEALGRGIFEYTLQLSFDSGSLFDEGGSYFAVFGLFVATPVAATLRFLAYIDGRARRDAWEVQIKMQRIVRLAARAV
ncbi:MAG: hypothetical protein QM756_42780 [Polyangiaceae bacterium]